MIPKATNMVLDELFKEFSVRFVRNCVAAWNSVATAHDALKVATKKKSCCAAKTDSITRAGCIFQLSNCPHGTVRIQRLALFSQDKWTAFVIARRNLAVVSKRNKIHS
jgi:hypothetical protein